MIVCATPRCGGTIFCIEEVNRLGLFGDRKARHHETRFQPDFDLKGFVASLLELDAPDKLFLVNGHVSLALQGPVRASG